MIFSSGHPPGLVISQLGKCIFNRTHSTSSADLVKELSDFRKDPSDMAELLERTFLTLFACVVVSILIQKFRHELVLPYLNRFLYLDLVLVALYLSQSWSVPIFIALLSYLLTPRPRLWPPHHDRSWVASLI